VSEARYAHITVGRQRPAAMQRPLRGPMCDPLKRIALTWIRQSPRAASRESGSTIARTDEARVRVRRSEMAEVGPTHRASDLERAARHLSGRALAEEHSA